MKTASIKGQTKIEGQMMFADQQGGWYGSSVPDQRQAFEPLGPIWLASLPSALPQPFPHISDTKVMAVWHGGRGEEGIPRRGAPFPGGVTEMARRSRTDC